MAYVRCDLPHPLFLVLPESCVTRVAKDYEGIPLPKSVGEVEQDFLSYSESGVLTLLDDRQPENLRISFCTSRYELVCGLSPQKDVYIIHRLAPLSLRTHNLIARGAVLAFPQTWGVYADLADLNLQVYSGTGAGKIKPSLTGIEALQSSWQQTRQNGQSAVTIGSPGPGLSPEQLTFLANVDTLIDIACQVELEQAARMERIPVKSVFPAAERPNTYHFELATLAEIRVGEYLHTGLGEAHASGTGYDGVVVDSVGTSLSLRFRQPVGISQLQKVEWLAPKISTRQYTIQHAAVNALRNNDALNPALLSLIVENCFESFPIPVITDPSTRPNLAQKSLIERALLVPDLLLALGPPGTGKTDTIREIVSRQAALGKKVLVTSKNNKAVDNVLEGLENVQMLRIGREEAVSAEIRPILIDNAAATLCQNILSSGQPVQANLDGLERLWPKISVLLDCLARYAEDWRMSLAALNQERERLAAWQRGAYARVQGSIDRQINHYQMMNQRLKQAAKCAEGLSRRLDFLHRLSKLPLIAPFSILLAERFASEWQAAASQYRDTLQLVRRSRRSIRKIWESYQQFVTTSEQALEAKSRVVQAEERLNDMHAGIVQTKVELSLLIETLPLLSTSVMGKPALRLDSPEDIEASLEEWRAWHELMLRRRGLLTEWHGLLNDRPQSLHPALVRGADVIGATCIGIATDARFEDLDFDLVIVDEAGQIQVMDLLVPLVRARRAVLVGDHLQLPPVVEPEIVDKIRENEPENQELGGWLEKSLFERLIENSATPESHRIMLDTQYRMPAQIAEFISNQFYGGLYHTGGQPVEHSDVFFSGSPMVFVDTSREVRHYEQRSEDGQGYFNILESRLICDLLLAYQAKGSEAGVIVPYKKQAEVIRRELRRRQSGLSEDMLVSRIATVDSFQGREMDVIIFGFTRSNAESRIGFLTELRRLNVSLTRARRQLVLVGDSITLTETADQDFAHLMKALLVSVKNSPKGYFHANELNRRLQS